MLRTAGRAGLLLLLVVALSGCSITGSVHWELKRHTVRGKVTFGHTGTGLTNVQVFFNGRIDRRVVTDEYGVYSVALPEGTYSVTIRTIHGDYTDRVTVRGSEVINFPIRPAWYDSELFYALSGMKRYDMDKRGTMLPIQYGEMERWTKPVVRVYFDTYGAPWDAPGDWDNHYFNEIDRWHARLGGRVQFVKRKAASQADVVVHLVAPGSLGSGVAAQHTRVANYGALDFVRIWIDVDYARESSLWEHEWAHAMGVHHSYDTRSVMYPAVLSGQRTSLSSDELRHIRLMYDLPPGIVVKNPWSALSIQSDAEDEDEDEFTHSPSGWTYSGHIRTADGRTIELSEYEVQDLLYATE